MKLSPAVQTLLLKAGSKQATAGCFSANILKSSLDKSLTELKFDYVDFLFLHEPTGDVFRDEELLSALGDVIRLGKVRFVGVSASPDVISVAMNLNMPVISAVQMPCNVLESLAIGVARNVHEREKVTVVNQPFGGVDGVRETRLRIEKVTRGGHVPAEIQKRFAVIDDALLADIVLNTVLSTSKANVILPSMMRPAHIANAVSAISNSRLTPEEMSWFADQMLLGPNAH